MRNHVQIIDDAGGYTAFARRLTEKPSRVRFWRTRESIPSPYWKVIADLGLATLDELADAVAVEVNSDIAEPSHTDEHNNTITDGADYGRVTGELARG